MAESSTLALTPDTIELISHAHTSRGTAGTLSSMTAHARKQQTRSHHGTSLLKQPQETDTESDVVPMSPTETEKHFEQVRTKKHYSTHTSP